MTIAVGIQGEIYATLLLKRGEDITFEIVRADAQELPPITDKSK